MLSGSPSSAASSDPKQAVVEPAALLQEFLKGNGRQRQRLWKTLPCQAPELADAIWDLLETQERQPDDWAIGSLLRLLAADPDQLAKLQATYPEGWLVAPGIGAERCAELQWCLMRGELEEADRLTTAQLRALAGPAAEERGYVYFSEVPGMPIAELAHLDSLWWFYSGGRYGFRIQRQKIERLRWRWEQLWPQIGWKNEGSWTRYPGAFTWSHDAPEGHMPLVNQLRGVRLMDAYLRHPAIDQALEAP